MRDLLTTDRLSSYLSRCDNDLGRALELYEWNLNASAAVLQTTGMVEVIVRNALDNQLVAWATSTGSPWPDIAPLDPLGRTDIARAIERATDKGRTPRVHGKLVAELIFGFWRYLTAKRYLASMWVPVLHRAFPDGDHDLRKRRVQVERHLAGLLLVRNRAAHHEPIHKRNLTNDLASAIKVATWIHPDAGAWIAQASTLTAAVAVKPASST